MFQSRSGVGVYSAEAGAQSESKIFSDSVHLWFDPLSLHKVRICENETAIDYHHGSALKSKKSFSLQLNTTVGLSI